MCPLAGWASSGRFRRTGARRRLRSFPADGGNRYAMNMRAAEAIVSSAPKPMKIFPISEVWSQVEFALLLAASPARRRSDAAARPRPSRAGRSAGWRALVQRAIDIVELIGGNDLGVGGRLDVGRIAARLQISLARADIALAHRRSAYRRRPIRALALATDGGIADDLSPSSAARRPSVGGRGFQPPPCWIYDARSFSSGASRVWRVCGSADAAFRFRACGRIFRARRRLRWPRQTYKKP